MRILFAHASSDKPAVRNLYQDFQPWLDEEDLVSIQNWALEILKAAWNTDAVMVCLSPRFTTRKGYIQNEIKFAPNVVDGKPESVSFVVPAKLEIRDVPECLSRLNWADVGRDLSAYDAASFPDADRKPVELLSSEVARAFVPKLNENLGAGGLRLPTDAE